MVPGGLLLAAPGRHGGGTEAGRGFRDRPGAARWSFSEGREFPGRTGGFERAAEAAHGGKFGGRLRFDFSGGGSYVAAVYRTDHPPDVAAVRVWLKKPAGHTITFRYTDQTGQTFQKPVFVLDDRWCDVLIGVEGFALHWGGANDGIIHGPPMHALVRHQQHRREDREPAARRSPAHRGPAGHGRGRRRPSS